MAHKPRDTYKAQTKSTQRAAFCWPSVRSTISAFQCLTPSLLYCVNVPPRRRGDSLRPTVPEPIMTEIRRENLEYWRKVTILNERYATSRLSRSLSPGSSCCLKCVSWRRLIWDGAAGRYFEFMKALLHEDEDEDEDAETPRETNADMVLHKIKVRPMTGRSPCLYSHHDSLSPWLHFSYLSGR